MRLPDFGLNMTGDSWTAEVESISAQRRLLGEAMNMTATNSTRTGVAFSSTRRRFFANEDGEESHFQDLNIGFKDLVGLHRRTRRKSTSNAPFEEETPDTIEMDLQAVVFFMSFTFVGRSDVFKYRAALSMSYLCSNSTSTFIFMSYLCSNITSMLMLMYIFVKFQRPLTLGEYTAL